MEDMECKGCDGKFKNERIPVRARLGSHCIVIYLHTCEMCGQIHGPDGSVVCTLAGETLFCDNGSIVSRPKGPSF